MSFRRSGKENISGPRVSFRGIDNASFTSNDENASNSNKGPISIISYTSPATLEVPSENSADDPRNRNAFPGTDNGSVFPGTGNGSAFPGPNKAEAADSQDVVPRDTGVSNFIRGAKNRLSSVRMKKSINLLYCTAILVAVTGHSSIFIAPSQIMNVTGSLGGSLIVWLVGGFINMGTALCFTEMGTMFPKAGGPYAYAMQSFGPLVGFLIMWGYTILIAGPFWAFLAFTAALYIIRPIFTDCLPDDMLLATRLLAGWLMVTFVVLNCVYMKYVTKVQTLLSSSKILVMLIIIIAGIYELGKGETENMVNMFENTTTNPGQIALGLFYSVFAYGGWQVITTMLEEIKNPSRDPPRAVYISFIIVIANYVITNAAYGTLLTSSEIIDSSAVALDFMGKVSRPLMIIVSVLVALTSIGALNASIMGHSRLLFAGARNGHMPQILGMLHIKYLTPWPSIFVFTTWALIMLFTGGVTDMIDFISLFSTIMTLIVISSLLYLRWKKPDQDRPYKTWIGIPIFEIIINLLILVLAIYEKPQKMGVGLAILFAGIPVYWFGVQWKNKPKDFTKIIDNLTKMSQKIFLVSKTKKS